MRKKLALVIDNNDDDNNNNCERNIYTEDDFVLCKDAAGNIKSCGFSINSLLLKKGMSPMMTIQRFDEDSDSDHDLEGADTTTKVSDIFQNLAVPAGIYYMHQPKKTYHQELEEEEDEIDDSLFDQLVALASESNIRKRATRKMRMPLQIASGGKKKSRKQKK